jgi:hypothetical protein
MTTMDDFKKEDVRYLFHSISMLDAWIERNGWAGYDPYDVLDTDLLLYLQRGSSLPLKVLRRIFYLYIENYPGMARKILGIKKQINAKGMGLLAKGYLNLYQATDEESYKKKALQCLAWLKENPSSGYHGLCWGYPFDWQTKVFIPKGTPSAVVTSVVGDAFWRAYEVFGDRSYLKYCESICEFFLADLNIDSIDNDAICFSYTPVDNFHVHNANLFAAEFLARVGKEVKRKIFVEMGIMAANYALREQNPDGSLFYWGRVQNDYCPNSLDHYHSGFEIRMLYGMWKVTDEARYLDAAKKYYIFYLKHFVIKKGDAVIPKMTPLSLYPVDIHSCAEAMLCNATLSNTFEEARALIRGLSSWIIPKMQTEEGYYIYLIHKYIGFERKINIPYMRWGQGWMLLALSECLLAERNRKSR